MGRGPCPESGDPFGHLFPKGRSHGRLDTPFQLKGWGLLTSKRPHKRLKSLCAVATPTGLCAQPVIQGCTEPPRAGPRTAGGLPQTLHFRGGVQHLDGFVNHDRSAETPPQGTWAQDKTEENVEGPPPKVTRTGSQEKAGAQRKADAVGPPGVGDTHGGGWRRTTVTHTEVTDLISGQMETSLLQLHLHQPCHSGPAEALAAFQHNDPRETH